MAKSIKSKSAKKITKAAKKTSDIKKKPAKKAAPKKKLAKKSGKKKDDLMCFLTTACVDHYNLADNGYELNTLRRYRDSYLAATETGQQLIKDYYRVSPGIVKRINADAAKTTLYDFVYTQVKKACAEIEKQNYVLAKKVYVFMVQTLMRRYAVS